MGKSFAGLPQQCLWLSQDAPAEEEVSSKALSPEINRRPIVAPAATKIKIQLSLKFLR